MITLLPIKTHSKPRFVSVLKNIFPSTYKDAFKNSISATFAKYLQKVHTLSYFRSSPSLLYKHNFERCKPVTFSKNFTILSFCFDYTIQTPKMQLNMKNISNIFQILKIEIFARTMLKNWNILIRDRLCRNDMYRAR